MMMEKMASSMVFGSACAVIWTTVWCEVVETPRLPVRTPPSQVKYWTMSGLSMP